MNLQVEVWDLGLWGFRVSGFGVIIGAFMIRIGFRA